jgi:hypothetical protein
MITQRRVFQAKVGAAGAVVAQIRQFQTMAQKHGFSVTSRVYTDFLSGRTDRVAWEWDLESLGQMENLEAGMAQNAETQKEFESWFSGLTPLIEGATVELWQRQE